MTERLQKQLAEVREMQRRGIVSPLAADRVRRMGTDRWCTLPDCGDSIVYHLCNVCGYEFGAQRTSAFAESVTDLVVAEQKAMHDEVCRSGRFSYG